MSGSIPLVYIDTNLFAYHLLSSNYSGDIVTRTNKFFKDIQDGRYQATISTFTETEYRSVVKKVISQQKNAPITPSEENAAMNDFNTFYNGMGIGLTDSDVLSYNTNTSLIDIFTMTGDTILLNIDPFLYNHNTKCKVVGGTDAILLNFAIRSGASLFATFDNGFRGLRHPSIQALIIPDVYSI